MEKHYTAPEFEICELRLTDVILVSKDDDEWEVPIKKGSPSVKTLTPQMEIDNNANGDGLY